MSEPTHKSRLSDDMVDGITALVLIILAVSATVYWLTTLPTS